MSHTLLAMKQLLLLCFLLPILFGCGNIKEKFGRQTQSLTKVYFTKPKYFNPKLGSMATLNNGVLVYAIDLNDPQRHGAKRLENDLDKNGWSIPTGFYQFLAVGYTNPNLAGPVYCGISSKVHLSGQPQTISIAMDQNLCGQYPFVEPEFSTGSQPKPIQFANCTPGNMASQAPGNVPCFASLGPTGNIQVDLTDYDAFDGSIHVDSKQNSTLPDIASNCMSVVSGSLTTPAIVIPTGSAPPYDAFVFGVNYYVGACSTTHSLLGAPRGVVGLKIPGQSFFLHNLGNDVTQFVQPTDTPPLKLSYTGSGIFLHVSAF